MKKDISIEYAHIYTNQDINNEQKFSIEILEKIISANKEKDLSLVVMVDDYSFPDTSFDYTQFTSWLREEGFPANIILKESQLITSCNKVLSLIQDKIIKKEISSYIETKKYPCSLFIATWYLLRLGLIVDPIFDKTLVAKKLINILPLSFKPFEDKAFEIIESTNLDVFINQIENKYFEGRKI